MITKFEELEDINWDKANCFAKPLLYMYNNYAMRARSHSTQNIEYIRVKPTYILEDDDRDVILAEGRVEFKNCSFSNVVVQT